MYESARYGSLKQVIKTNLKLTLSAPEIANVKFLQKLEKFQSVKCCKANSTICKSTDLNGHVK